MPIQDGQYIKLTEDEIYQRFERNLEDILGVTAEPGDLVKKQLEAEAKTIAQNQEEALERVYYATYLEDATGKELDKIVDLIGIDRQEATSATGTVQFSRDTPPISTYIIPRGAEIQTEGNDPIEFQTTEQTELSYIDGWEENNLDNWDGDKTSFNIVSSGAINGTYSLEKPATDNVEIWTLDTYQIGTTFDVELKPSTDAAIAIQVGRQDSSNYYEAEIDASGNDLRLREVQGGTVQNNNSEPVTIPTGQTSHVEIEWQLYGDLVLRLYETKEKQTEIGSVFLDEVKHWTEGSVAIHSGGSTATALLDDFSTSATTANIEAIDTGIDTNVAPNQIRDMKTSISGPEDVINHAATGNDSFQNTDFDPFVTGEAREDDEQLRERAFDNTSIGGSATAKAIGTKIEELDGVQSVKIFQNKTEGTSDDGLPPHSFEPVIYGGDDQEIAETIFNTASIDSTDYGGVHGNEASYTVTSDVMASSETINWSRPTKLDVNVTVDLIVDDTYVGDDKIRSLIVSYIGGTEVDGSFVPGVLDGEDVYEAVLKQTLTDPSETGVWEVDSLSFDKDGDGADDTTTTASGAEILAVADSEVAQANARDGSITVNTTTK